MSGSPLGKKEFGLMVWSILSFGACLQFFLRSHEPNLWINALPLIIFDLLTLLYLHLDRRDNGNNFNVRNLVLVYLFILQDIVFVGSYCYCLQEYGVNNGVVEILIFALPLCWILRGFGLFIVALKGYFQVDKSGYEEIWD